MNGVSEPIDDSYITVDEFLPGDSQVIRNPDHCRHNAVVKLIGEKNVEGKYPVRESNGNTYLVTLADLRLRVKGKPKTRDDNRRD